MSARRPGGDALRYRALLRTIFVAFDIPMDRGLAIAEAEARRALEIDPSLAYGRHGLANVSAARRMDRGCRSLRDRVPA